MINISVQTLSQFAKRQVKAMKEGLPTRSTVESGKNYRFKVIAGEFEGRMERLRLPRLHARIERGEKKNTSQRFNEDSSRLIIVVAAGKKIIQFSSVVGGRFPHALAC